ncbi:hypothetical protein [Catenulispora rubra]|uniref:hypothetical protein n=1 Tax=Catenulispora rubra TaxID=280293 RepID=UPI001892242A|nr:hypothetical protein [Catenulispora rubra]
MTAEANRRITVYWAEFYASDVVEVPDEATDIDTRARANWQQLHGPKTAFDCEYTG